LRNSQHIDFLHHIDVASIDCSARNCYGFSADVTNILRLVRVLRCKGSHIVVSNSRDLKNHIIPIAVSHCGMEMFDLSSKPSLRYDRSDAVADMRQIFEAAVFGGSECVAVLKDVHLNIDTSDIFLSAINWVDTVGHVCFDESWMLDQCQHFLETGICGYTSEETIKNMKTRFFANFHAIVCCSDDDASKMKTIYSHSSSVFQVYLVHSPPLKCISRHPPL